MYGPLNCSQFYDSKYGAEEGLSYDGISTKAVCKNWFKDTTKYQLNAKNLGLIRNTDFEKYNNLNNFMSKYLVQDGKYLDKERFDSCYNFFQDNGFFIPRDIYLKLLDEQINVLEV